MNQQEQLDAAIKYIAQLEKLLSELPAIVVMDSIDHNAATLTQAHHVNAPIMESMLIREVQS